jgi:hypothetical protein
MTDTDSDMIASHHQPSRLARSGPVPSAAMPGESRKVHPSAAMPTPGFGAGL